METTTLHSRRINWRRAAPQLVMHVGAIAAPWTFAESAVYVAIAVYILCGLGISLGFHRLFSHHSYRASRLLEYVLATFGTLANQGSLFEWVTLHRIHHAHSDDSADPHTPTRGFWWGHMLWMFEYDPRIADPASREKYTKDLSHDRYFRWLDRHANSLQLAFAALLFALGQWFFACGLAWVVWGMCVRSVALNHATWTVNSICHTWGYQSFSTNDRSRNNPVIAALTFGEGWHNNHHANPSSARFGQRWWELDVAFQLIRLCKFCRIACEIKR